MSAVTPLTDNHQPAQYIYAINLTIVKPMLLQNNILKNTFSSGTNMHLLKGGSCYFNLLLQLIKNAQTSIHIQTYIFDEDETGMLVADTLKAAAKRNVKIYLLVDGYASKSLSDKFITGLKDTGIHFRFFKSLFREKHFYFGRRLHHKVAVIDTRHALVGGINISNRYNDMPGKPAWLDFALYAEGEIANELCILCWKTWNNFSDKKIISNCEITETKFLVQANDTLKVRMRRNDWVRRKNEISLSYIEMFRNAQTSIIIFSSYFLPGKIIRRVLAAAAARGVSIKVVTAGRSDVMISKYAERWLYDWLLRHNIELYEYQPTVLHAKVAVCDGEWFTLGSYNINNISAYASIELNLDVRNTFMASSVQHQLEKIIEENCIHVTMEQHLKAKNFFNQFLRWFSYQFIRLVLYLVTFYFKKQK